MKLIGQGTGAGLVGAVFLLVSSTNAYLSLQRGADRLWGFRPCSQPLDAGRLRCGDSFERGLRRWALVVLIGFFVVLDQLTTNLRLLSPGSWRLWLQKWLPSWLHLWAPVPWAVDFGLSILISCALAYALMAVPADPSGSGQAPTARCPVDWHCTHLLECWPGAQSAFAGQSLSGLWRDRWCVAAQFVGVACGACCVLRHGVECCFEPPSRWRGIRTLLPIA